MTTAADTPYLIVGAGPVGLTAARLLANAGRRCVIVERRDGPQRNPAAHVVNARTLEIFRQAGVDMASIAAISQSPDDAGHVNFLTRLNGRLIGRLPFERQGDDCLAHTPLPLRNISQHRLEPLLSAEVGALAEVDLRYRSEWVSGSQTDDGVTSVIRDLRTGEETAITSRYVFAADGAGSDIRRWLGIEMIGPAGIQSFVTIHVRANLRHLVEHRPGVLHFVMDPETPGTFVAHDVDHDWVFMTAFDPMTESADDYGPERCARIVMAAIGDDQTAIEVIGSGTWHMTAQVAESMRDRRVFLMGDAAHRFPPTGGMGLNTGVADAHNLIWKVLAVEDGWASASLLESYEAERRPIAEINCHQSLSNAFKMVLLAQALDLRPGSSSADLEAVLADPTRAESIAAAVNEQAAHFDMLGLQIGYVYGDTTDQRGRDPGEFTPTAVVGSRVPHGWLGDGRSTLDLVEASTFTLLTCGGHDTWHDAVSQLEIPVRHVALGADVSVEASWADQCGLGPDGALLVRPDQHIAWRSAAIVPDAVDDLVRAARGYAG
ncbi:MAG: 2,4-dichlorophenol 6-monooxygenase [Actinomycetota bacterium]